MKLMKRLVREEEGQGLAEYALILGLIVLVVIAVMSGVGEKIRNQFTKIGNTLPS